jgi:hypothetical protein
MEIRRLFNFRVASVQDADEMVTWLIEEILPDEQKNEAITELVYQRFRELQLEPPTKLQVERLIKSAIAKYETDFQEQILDKLTLEMTEQIDVLLSTEETEELENDERLRRSTVKLKMSDFAFLKTDPGAVGLGSFLIEIKKLRRIRAVGLPTNLFEGKSSKLVKTYRHRAATETPYLFRQHPPAIRYTLMAAFCIQRAQEITDSLIEILTSIIKRIDNRAEKRINQELIEEFKKVSGKTGLLYRIAEVSIAEPNGVIEQVIFPVVSLKTLKDLVAESLALRSLNVNSCPISRIIVRVIGRMPLRRVIRQIVSITPATFQATHFGMLNRPGLTPAICNNVVTHWRNLTTLPSLRK